MLTIKLLRMTNLQRSFFSCQSVNFAPFRQNLGRRAHVHPILRDPNFLLCKTCKIGSSFLQNFTRPSCTCYITCDNYRWQCSKISETMSDWRRHVSYMELLEIWATLLVTPCKLLAHCMWCESWHPTWLYSDQKSVWPKMGPQQVRNRDQKALLDGLAKICFSLKIHFHLLRSLYSLGRWGEVAILT